MHVIHEILKKSAADYPLKEAAVCGKSRLTYSEIEEASSRLAGFLISQGIKNGDRVGIFTVKNIEEIIAIFAILKIGAVFVHINPSFKEGQLAHVISDCGIKALFASQARIKVINSAFSEKCPLDLVISLSSEMSLSDTVSTRTYFLDDILRDAPNDEISGVNISDKDVAAIIYTSGSTGMPKGVIVTHRIFCDSTEISAGVLENNPEDRLICTAPYSFDGALSQLFTAFMSGGAVVQQPSSFPGDIVRTLIDEKITGFHAVPSLWNILLQKHSPLSRYEYPHLRYVSITGEPFHPKYLETLRSLLKKTNIYIMYGTTEAFRSTYLPPGDLDAKPGSVGIPFPGVTISIVNKQNIICRPHEVGEIVHNGVFVSPGYWNQPDKTAAVFREDGLHTGDLGKLDEDGYLYFIGREDGMVKSQGFRISPEEIEYCLYQVEEVKEAAVIGISKEDGSKWIKAVVSCKEEKKITEKDIIAHCRRLLPHYMVPVVVEFRESLPRTVNNKINRTALY
jgi:amino acid adenylation domain-containing protein